jgi:hypothetical protein
MAPTIKVTFSVDAVYVLGSTAVMFFIKYGTKSDY